MPIQGIQQPDMIRIDDELRLVRYTGECEFALGWYQDPEMIWMIDNSWEPYTLEKLKRMYAYLDRMGELYWITYRMDGAFVPVGDVTFWQDDMPIVIGLPELRGRGIGRRVVQALVQRGRALGYDELRVHQVYHYNQASQRCFESAGFQHGGCTEKGQSYFLRL